MSDKWPFLGDSPKAKLRRLTEWYRMVALRADPESTAKVDVIAAQVGEMWIVPHLQVWEEDDLVMREQAASILCVKPNTVTHLASRGRLTRHYYYDGRMNRYPKYRAGDVYELLGKEHGRNRK